MMIMNGSRARQRTGHFVPPHNLSCIVSDTLAQNILNYRTSYSHIKFGRICTSIDINPSCANTTQAIII